jgi:CRP/FNR family transcriptional regulator
MLTATALPVAPLPAPAPAVPKGVAPAAPSPAPARPVQAAGRRVDDRQAGAIGATFQLLADVLAPQKRMVHAGDVIYRAGERFDCLHVLHAGLVKVVKLAEDGREQVVGIKFRGDWLGLDGIAAGAYGCDSIAMDTGEVWSIRYDRLIEAGARHPALLTALLGAMSLEIARERDSLMSVCTLTADARVANFLRFIAESQSSRGLRDDQISLRMSRGEIGNHLGLTLESVSRALSRLARDKIIVFAGKGRREVCIPDVAALSCFVQRSLCPASPTLQ